MTTIHNASATRVTSLDSNRGTTESGGSLLPAASSANPATMLAILQLECLSQSNKAAEQSRDAYDLAEAAAEKARIEEMNKKNTETMILGVIGAAATVVQGSLNLAGGISENKQTAEKLKGAAVILEGSGKALDSAKNFNAGRKDIHIAEQEAMAKAMKRASERLGHAIDTTGQAESKVRQLIAEIVRGQDQCTRAALFRSA